VKRIDIGANLTDGMFRGEYNNKKVHLDDLVSVIKRARDVGVEKIIITSGNLKDVEESIKLALTDDCLYTTVGVHPTRCLEFESNPDQYLNSLMEVYKSAPTKFVAVGEFGLGRLLVF